MSSMFLQTIATSWEYVPIFLWTIITKHNLSRLEENSNLEVVFKKAMGKEKNRKESCWAESACGL